MEDRHIKRLRGDRLKDVLETYVKVDPEDVCRSYLANIPLLGIYPCKLPGVFLQGFLFLFRTLAMHGNY